MMRLDHPRLVKRLQLAYSAERAAALAYIGHAGSVRDLNQKSAIRQIELDEWHHREAVLCLMHQYGIAISKYDEMKYYVIGRLISWACHVIGWFMPYYFAGRLESGNVCEYFMMMRDFNELGITEHDELLYEMGITEKKHEVYFQQQIEGRWELPIFEALFGWGSKHSFNDVDLANRQPIAGSKAYCRPRD